MHFKSLLVPHPQLKLVDNFGNLNIVLNTHIFRALLSPGLFLEVVSFAR